MPREYHGLQSVGRRLNGVFVTNHHSLPANQVNMGHRLSKIYTRTGDSGTTGLANLERVPKFHPRIEANGTIDEANSAIALILTEDTVPDSIRANLLQIQNELFNVGAELTLPGYVGVEAAAVERLEADIDALNQQLPPLKEFILPGGGRAAANCHLARAICRRAERIVWVVAEDAELNPHMLQYLNRLSDYLFTAARSLAAAAKVPETLWQKPANPGSL